MTAPPLMATSSAFCTPPLSAAAAVRAFERVAIHMPTTPAAALATAPAIKATEVCQFNPRSGRTTPTIPRRTAITTTKPDTHMYSCLRNAPAPSCTARDNSAIFSVPCGFEST